MNTGSMGRLVVRLAAVLALAGLTVACASPQHGPTVAPAGYGKDDASRAARLVQYCDRLAAKGELVTALGLCARAHEIDPDNPETLMKVAAILQSLDRGEAAAQTYGLLLERHPGHQEARYSLGKLYMQSGEHSLAAMHFDQAIRANPEDPRPYNALGILRDQAGEHQAAQALYRTALERDPGNLSVRNNLGLSLALSGQRDAAIDVLAELAVDPAANETVLRNLEAAYAARNLPAGGEPATAMETPPAAAVPVEPVEVKRMDIPAVGPGTGPATGPAPGQRKAPAAPAPTVEAVPEAPASEPPTPLYPPKPSAVTAPKPTAAKQEARPASAGRDAAAPSSVILAAAEQLMAPPAWADFEPGDLVAALPDEAPAARAPVVQEAPASPSAAAVQSTPRPGTAKYHSLAKGSVFSNI